MVRTEAEKPRRKETGERERMSDHELGNLLAAFGNHEGRALLLASFVPHRKYSRDDTHGIMLSKQGPKEVWKISSSVPFGWCESTLASIGRVVRETSEPRGSSEEYELTEYGEEIGQALAGSLLRLSEKNSTISLFDLLGPTSSTAKTKEAGDSDEAFDFKLRPPLARFRIFLELAKATGPLREADLVHAFIEKYRDDYRPEDIVLITRNIASHLDNLSQRGIITYRSIEADAAFAFYQSTDNPPQDPPPKYVRLPGLTQAVYTIIPSLEVSIFSRDDIYSKLVEENPQYGHLNKATLKSDISNILAGLNNDGYVKNVGEFKLGKQSEITFSRRQKKVIRAFTELIEEFRKLDPEFLKDGRGVGREITSDTKRFSALLKKAKEASPNANQTDSAETSSHIMQYLQESDEARSLRDIQQFLLIKHKKRLGTARIREIMALNSKSVKVTKEGKRNFYSLKSSEDGSSLPQSATIFEAPKK